MAESWRARCGTGVGSCPLARIRLLTLASWRRGIGKAPSSQAHKLPPSRGTTPRRDKPEKIQAPNLRLPSLGGGGCVLRVADSGCRRGPLVRLIPPYSALFRLLWRGSFSISSAAQKIQKVDFGGKKEFAGPPSPALVRQNPSHMRDPPFGGEFFVAAHYGCSWQKLSRADWLSGVAAGRRPARRGIVLDETLELRQIYFCQGPWNVDLRIPPGQECSNGSLLCIRRGHPGIFLFTICDIRLTTASLHWRVNRMRNLNNDVTCQCFRGRCGSAVIAVPLTPPSPQGEGETTSASGPATSFI